ncbi:MAG: phospholipase A [Sulfurimicrobium sp.]|nr:phospholipase A [Sulfurimicrobium sp.]
MPESSENDDNPDISRYMGHGDVLINYNHNQTSIGIGLSLQEWR